MLILKNVSAAAFVNMNVPSVVKKLYGSPQKVKQEIQIGRYFPAYNNLRK